MSFAGGSGSGDGGFPFWSRESWRRGSFPAEIVERGEPDMRPERGSIVVPRTAGMAALERQYRNHALYATCFGGRQVISGYDLLEAIEAACGSEEGGVRIEVACPPHHFFLVFNSDNYCTRVLTESGRLWCADSHVQFARWHPGSRATRSELPYKARLSFGGFLDAGIEPDTLSFVVAGLGGDIIRILPREDREIVTLDVWLKDPNCLPKELDVEVPVANPLPFEADSDNDCDSPARVCSPQRRVTEKFSVKVHLKKVLNRGQLVTDLPASLLPDEGVDLSRVHCFRTWRERVDGTGPGDRGFA